ncbi:nocobactin polyketide synthase NbtC [Nocardia sp. NPDC051463]|uniref:nocobactin polyketide synthase NbtC n=1 Tax=Nocardia sp. NPDC051463 TaxID=3154845 RepID=UPI00342B706B
MSADAPGTLCAEAAAMLSYVSERPGLEPERIADMLFRTRVVRRHRALLMVTDRDQLGAALQAVRSGAEHPRLVRSTEPAAARRLAYILPGQGSQRPGMGRLFYDRAPVFRDEVDRCDALFRELFGESPLTYLLDADADADAVADDSAHIVQPALFTQMVGLGALWRSVGIVPEAVVGHSQGEIAAAYLAGAMSLADAIVVVGTRAHAVDKISSDNYAMAVVAADRDECEELLARQSGWAQVSVVNSPRMVGISGDRDTVQTLVDVLGERGRFARVIRVRYPAHTSMLNEFRDVIRDAVHDKLTSSHFLDTDIACLGATLGDVITSDLPVEDYWFWNLRNPVRFDRAVAAAVEREVDTFVELAEHPTLQLAVEENLAEFAAHRPTMVTSTSSRTAVDLTEFTRNLAGLAVNDLNYRWECLRTEPDAPVRLPLPDFPNVQMNEMTLWLAHDVTLGNARAGARADAAARPRSAAAELSEVSEPSGARAQQGISAPQLLVENWVRLVQRSMMAPRALGIVDHTGGQAELATALCAHATAQGLTARLIDTTTGAGSGDFAAVVVLLPNLPEMDGSAAIAEVSEFFGHRRWWSEPDAAVTEYWLVTIGGESVIAEDTPPHPVHAAAGAGFRSAGAEYSGIAFRHLDLAPAQAGPDAVSAIIGALHTADEPELALRAGNLYAKRLTEADRTDIAAPTVPDNVVITGGTGSLGLEFCEDLVRRGAQRIALVSRSGETAAVARRLRRIRALGSTEISVMTCDIGDSAAVTRLADQLTGAPAQLIIHAAADNSSIVELELAQITPERVDNALRGKIVGIENVLRSLTTTDDCQVVLCSSLAATLGGRGTVVYSAVNRMLDAFAARSRAAGVRCVSVQWGQWAVFQGRGESDIAQLAEVGYLPMDSADAIELGLAGLPHNAIVAAFDWDRGRSVLGAFGYGPVLSGLRTPSEPGSGPTPVVAPAQAQAGTDVSGWLARLLAEIIGAEDLDMIDSTRPLVAIGLDSLQALELRRRVKSEFGYELPVADLIGGASLDDVVRLIGSRPGAAVVAAAPIDPAPQQNSASAAAMRAPAPESADRVDRARLAAQHAVTGALDVDTFRSARRDMDLFGLHAMMAALQPALSEHDFRTVDDIATRLEFADRHRWLLRQWLQALTEHGCLDHDPVHGYRYLRPVPSPIRPDLVEVCADLGYSRPLATFLTAADDNLTALAQDRIRVQELLFPNGDMATAEAAYRDNLGSRYLNLAAGRAVADVVDGLRRDRSPVRILELGAGIGGTSDDVTAALVGLPVEYHFTDVSTFFLDAAKKRFADYPWMRYGIVDMNADLAQQPRFDIVIAANVLHNAYDIGVTLGQLHNLLNPGGAVVIIETCHAHCQLLTSVHFLMSPRAGQPHAGLTDVRAGTDRIFLTEREWQDELLAVGLTPTLVLPDGDHPVAMLDQRVFVAVRGPEA